MWVCFWIIPASFLDFDLFRKKLRLCESQFLKREPWMQVLFMNLVCFWEMHLFFRWWQSQSNKMLFRWENMQLWTSPNISFVSALDFSVICLESLSFVFNSVASFENRLSFANKPIFCRQFGFADKYNFPDLNVNNSVLQTISVYSTKDSVLQTNSVLF